jgi:hypothetical protein
MRVPTTCKCGEEIFFDIDTVGNFRPSDLYSISDRIRKDFGEVNPELINEILKDILEGSEFKRLRFFQECPQCGCEQALILLIPLN